MTDDRRVLSRRRVLHAALALPMALRLGAATGLGLALTPDCADADEATTPATMEGPYFKPASPERARLREKDSKGTPLLVSGRVVTSKGLPVERALLDVWQADGEGEYDLAGFHLRGHQYTEKDGSYRLDTVEPGYYPGRTRHLHVKVQAPGQAVLTTQLFFPNDPRNRGDALYSTWLRMRVTDVDARRLATFEFVLPA